MGALDLHLSIFTLSSSLSHYSFNYLWMYLSTSSVLFLCLLFIYLMYIVVVLYVV